MSNQNGQNGVFVTLKLNLNADMADIMRSGFADALPETRAFPGCRSVHCYENPQNPHQLMLIEHWDSQEDYGRYIAWRQENGMMDAMGAALVEPAAPDFWTFLS